MFLITLRAKKCVIKAVRDEPFCLQYVPDWFVTQQQIELRDDVDDYCNDDDEIIEWYDGYKNRKTQKAKIEEELMRIACHPSRRWDWCMPEDEKKQTEKLWK